MTNARGPGLPLGRLLVLLGGLALVAAYHMPWFGMRVGNQGAVFSGAFLDQFLADPRQAAQALQGMSATQAGQLRLLVEFFPLDGALAALLALAGPVRPRLWYAWLALLGLLGVAPLAALAVGIPQLPAGASYEVGLKVLGAGGIAILLGLLGDVLVPRWWARRTAASVGR